MTWQRFDGSGGIVSWLVTSPSGGLPEGMVVDVQYDPSDEDRPWTVRANFLNDPAIGPAEIDQLLGGIEVQVP